MGPGYGTYVEYRLADREDLRMMASVDALAPKLERFLPESEHRPNLARALADRAVLGAFLDLSHGALTSGYDDGRVGGLSDAGIAMRGASWLVEAAIATPQQLGAALRDALLTGGVLIERERCQYIADFERDRRRIITDRLRKRKPQPSTAAPRSGRGASTEPPCITEPEPEPESETETKTKTESRASGEESLLLHLLDVTRWSGKSATMADALSQLRAAELSDTEVRSRMAALGKRVVGMTPYDLKNELLHHNRSGGSRVRDPAPTLQSHDDYAAEQAAAAGVPVAEWRRQSREALYPRE